ncbi:MAG: hypothetical protein GY953_15170 [bacterium]|nr:hypothetical protein [bacterium]
MHLGLGYGPFLLIVDAALVLAVVWDLGWYHLYLKLPLGLETLRIIGGQASFEQGFQAAKLVGVLLFLVPILISVLRVWSGLKPFGIEPLKWHGSPVVALHVVVSLGLAGAWLALPTLQVLAGMQFSDDGASYAFRPASAWVLGLLSSYLAAGLFTLLAGAIGVFGNRYVEEGDVPRWFREYYSRCVLSDPTGAFRPVHAGNKLNFNTGGRAPEIVYVRRLSEQLWMDWQARIPGSENAENARNEIETDCRYLLRGVLGPEGVLDACAIRYHASIGDAVQSVLSRLPKETMVLVSPYEHPTTLRVAKRHAKLASRPCHAISLHPNEMLFSRQAQVARTLERLENALGGELDNAVLFLSEDSFMTGTSVPVKEILEGVRSMLRGYELTVVMDGTYAVGNGRKVTIPDQSDHYLMRGERWLFAPDPVGIVVSPAGASSDTPDPEAGYTDREASQASIRALLGLKSGLRFLDEIGAETLWAHAREAKSYFLRHVGERFLPVTGPDSRDEASLMVTLRPRHRRDWRKRRQRGGLGQYFEENGVYVRVLHIEQGKPWVRISFAHFLSFHEIQKLIRLMDGAVKEVEQPEQPPAAAAAGAG